MNEELARDLAVLQDELAKLKPAVDHIKSASDSVAAAEKVLSNYNRHIEILFENIEKAFNGEQKHQAELRDAIFRETNKILADYTSEYERNVRKQADIGRDLLKEADEVVQEARSVNKSTQELVDNIYGMKISEKLLASLMISTISLALVITILIR